MIDIRGLTKVFSEGSGSDAVTALEDITLEINEGELFTIVGPSGCGKSTLLYIVAGFLDPTEGEVRLRDQPITEPGPDRAIVFQDTVLFPWLSVRENISFGLNTKRSTVTDDKDRIVTDLIDMVGLGDFTDHKPYELSGGMQQRVAIARALAINPEVLLMDEPFGALDSQTRQKLQSELLDIWKETNKTILFVTHDIPEATFLSDRVALLDSRPGRVKKVYDIDIPRPRRIDELYTSETYMSVISTIREDFPGFE